MRMLAFLVFILAISPIWLPIFDYESEGEPIAVPMFGNESYRPLSQGYSVGRAYELIPHGRTVFDYHQANMAEGERTYLHQIFQLVDYAVIERVQTMRALGGVRIEDPRNYAELMRNVQLLKVPASLEKFHRILMEAIYAQMMYFEAWRASGKRGYYKSSDSLVQASHQKLLAAYSVLMRGFPDEGPHNQKAFFDHLCALDFI
jgi:hypothetical protein